MIAKSRTDSAIDLSSGEHVLRTAIGRDIGIDIDQLSLASEKGGAPMTPSPTAVAAAPHRLRGTGTEGPAVTTVHEGRVSYDLRVDAASGTVLAGRRAVLERRLGGHHRRQDPSRRPR